MRYDCMNMLDAERIKLIKMQMKSVNAAVLKSWKNRTGIKKKYGEYAFLG